MPAGCFTIVAITIVKSAGARPAPDRRHFLFISSFSVPSRKISARQMFFREGFFFMNDPAGLSDDHEILVVSDHMMHTFD